MKYRLKLFNTNCRVGLIQTNIIYTINCPSAITLGGAYKEAELRLAHVICCSGRWTCSSSGVSYSCRRQRS